MNILFTGGKTQGHIQPIIALINEFKKNNNSENKKINLFYIGVKNGLEEKLIKNIESVNYISFKSYGLSKNIFKLILAIFYFIINFFKSFKILKKFKIDLVVSTGGFISVSVLKACQYKKIKYVIHEQNVIPGKSNKYLSAKALKIFVSFNELKYFNKYKNKVIYSGNPAASIALNSKIKSNQKYPNGYLKLLVVSGSQGSKKINECIKNMIDYFKSNNIFLTWITGEKYYLEYQKYSSNNVLIYPYTYLNIPLLKEADIVISRAGATTISEIIALKKPSILIPSKNVTNNHQEYNCDYLYNINAALKITDDNLNCENLIKLINKLIILRNNISYNLEKISVYDPAKKIYLEIMDILK